MVRPDLSTWGHILADLRRLAINAQHPHSRERLALYMIASQQTNATTWAARIGRTMERGVMKRYVPLACLPSSNWVVWHFEF